jgi:hypothetical protein
LVAGIRGSPESGPDFAALDLRPRRNNIKLALSLTLPIACDRPLPQTLRRPSQEALKSAANNRAIVVEVNAPESSLVSLPAPKSFRLAVASGLLLLLGGCVGGAEVSHLVIDPGKYRYYKCDQLAEAGQAGSTRARELKRLMDKSAAGPGGEIANALAYRGEYLSTLGDLKLMDEAAADKKCETPWHSASERSIQ